MVLLCTRTRKQTVVSLLGCTSHSAGFLHSVTESEMQGNGKARKILLSDIDQAQVSQSSFDRRDSS